MKKIVSILAILLFALEANAQTGAWSGKLDVQGTEITLVFHLDEYNPTMDSPDQGAAGIPIQIEKTITGTIIIRIPSIDVMYEGLWTVKQIVGTFKQRGVSFPLTLTPGEEKPNRPQTPQGPFPYSMEDVSFANGEAVLKGTLTLPEVFSRNTPVLIMVTGSGLQNRDEEVFEHKPFAVIADALVRAGIATLRYDDRGFGESSGDIVNCTTEDLKNDALAGIRMLREKFDRVGVLGHSEGGSIAMMLAAEKEADFIVSLAGAIVSGKEILLWQNRLALTASGVPETVVDTYCKLLDEAFDARINGTPLPSAGGLDLPDGLKQNYQAVTTQLQSSYMKYMLSMDMRPLLHKVTCPVLALNGTKDMQVECETNLGALREGFLDNPANRIDAVDGVNHIFQHCETGSIAEYRRIEETIAPEVLDIIVQWLNDLQ